MRTSKHSSRLAVVGALGTAVGLVAAMIAGGFSEHPALELLLPQLHAPLSANARVALSLGVLGMPALAGLTLLAATQRSGPTASWLRQSAQKILVTWTFLLSIALCICGFYAENKALCFVSATAFALGALGARSLAARGLAVDQPLASAVLKMLLVLATLAAALLAGGGAATASFIEWLPQLCAFGVACLSTALLLWLDLRALKVQRAKIFCAQDLGEALKGC